MMARDGRAWRDIESDEPLTANCPARATDKAHA